MADIVSVNWNVEEFRQLIAEQAQPGKKSVTGDATIELLGIEIDVSNKALPIHHGSANKSLHSITGQAQVPQAATSTDPVTSTLATTVIVSNERTGKRVSDQPAKTPLQVSLSNPEISAPHTSVQNSTGSGHNISQEVGKAHVNLGAQQGSAVSALPARVGMPNGVDRPLESNLRQSTTDPAETDDEHWALRQSILKPIVRTVSANHDDAMRLRWVLRDIAANRLKLSPVTELDSRTLVELKLVQIKDNTLQLTSYGAAAIK